VGVADRSHDGGVSPPTKGGKRGAFQNVRNVAGLGITLILYLLGLVLAGALLIGISVLIPVILERTFENARNLGWDAGSIAIGLVLVGLGVYVIRPLVNNRMRGQFWVEVPRPRFALAWGVVYLTGGVVFLFFGLRGT
jgi:hypothetical protein